MTATSGKLTNPTLQPPSEVGGNAQNPQKHSEKRRKIAKINSRLAIGLATFV
jgi:hypothetical protein